jgi:3D (Asp-Asp-Asp) domain-containing protein
MLETAAGETPAKHINFTNGNDRGVFETRAATIGDFLAERGISPTDPDRVSAPLDAPLTDGESVVYRRAVHVDIIDAGNDRSVSTPAATVGELIAAERLNLGPHDTVAPALMDDVVAGSTIRITRATSWLERIRSAISPPLHRTFDLAMRPGSRRVVDPGEAGTQETTVEVLQPDRSVPPRRLILAARVLRFPRARVVAEGVGDYSDLAGIARRGVTGTLRLADQALKMVATAYTGACSGCSGFTASGVRAGQGVVAVDPQIIPLGSRLFIPGYGHALAGDTGGAIRGHRIDLGFDSDRAAMTFGRRAVVVYVLK